jgi:hypothetical protein
MVGVLRSFEHGVSDVVAACGGHDRDDAGDDGGDEEDHGDHRGCSWVS